MISPIYWSKMVVYRILASIFYNVGIISVVDRHGLIRFTKKLFVIDTADPSDFLYNIKYKTVVVGLVLRKVRSEVYPTVN